MLPGGLLAAAVPVTGQQLGAFVRRSIVVAPPRVSVRPDETGPAAGGPPVPASVRGGSRPTGGHGPGQHDRRPTTGAGPAQAQAGSAGAGGPVVRRSLAETANSLFRSLLRSTAPSASDPVLAERNGMFDNSASEPAVVRRFRQPNPDHPDHGDALPDEEHSPAMRARDFDELIDRIVAKLEHRILEDLERRGRRSIPGVF
ncbi:MAG TPA: hypothetical protein VFU36_12600 [Jatrophihabitans sp.]|nr:hypothetical protein [Jatrophihabitans sp.]